MLLSSGNHYFAISSYNIFLSDAVIIIYNFQGRELLKFYYFPKYTLIIESFPTIAEALLAITKYEAGDVIDGIYAPDFYTVVHEDHCIIA